MNKEKKGVSSYSQASSSFRSSRAQWNAPQATSENPYFNIELNTSREQSEQTPYQIEKKMKGHNQIRFIKCQHESCFDQHTIAHNLQQRSDLLGISLIHKGSKSFLVEDKEFVVKAGHAFIWDHHLRGNFPTTDPVQIYTMIFPKYILESRVPDINTIINIPFDMSHGVAAITAAYMVSMIENSTSIEEHHETKLLDMFLELISLSFSPLHFTSTSKHRRDLLHSIKTYINQNIKNPALNPSMLAEQFSISTRYIHDLFKDEGISISKYITETRLEMCRRDLAHTHSIKKKVIDIAFKWGFNDAAHFSKLFKKKYGIAPSKYQESVQQNHV